MKLRIGQKVRIKNSDWFNSIESNGYYGPSGTYYNEEMRSYAGRLATIRRIEECAGQPYFVYFEEFGWTWHVESICECGSKYTYRPSKQTISLYNVWRNMKADGFDRPWVDKFVQDVVFNGTVPRLAMRKLTPHTTYNDDVILTSMCNYVIGYKGDGLNGILGEDDKWLTYLIVR